jgi:hypothetical protein
MLHTAQTTTHPSSSSLNPSSSSTNSNSSSSSSSSSGSSSSANSSSSSSAHTQINSDAGSCAIFLEFVKNQLTNAIDAAAGIKDMLQIISGRSPQMQQQKIETRWDQLSDKVRAFIAATISNQTTELSNSLSEKCNETRTAFVIGKYEATYKSLINNFLQKDNHCWEKKLGTASQETKQNFILSILREIVNADNLVREWDSGWYSNFENAISEIANKIEKNKSIEIVLNQNEIQELITKLCEIFITPKNIDRLRMLSSLQQSQNNAETDVAFLCVMNNITYAWIAAHFFHSIKIAEKLLYSTTNIQFLLQNTDKYFLKLHTFLNLFLYRIYNSTRQKKLAHEYAELARNAGIFIQLLLPGLNGNENIRRALPQEVVTLILTFRANDIENECLDLGNDKPDSSWQFRMLSPLMKKDPRWFNQIVAARPNLLQTNNTLEKNRKNIITFFDAKNLITKTKTNQTLIHCRKCIFESVFAISGTTLLLIFAFVSEIFLFSKPVSLTSAAGIAVIFIGILALTNLLTSIICMCKESLLHREKNTALKSLALVSTDTSATASTDIKIDYGSLVAASSRFFTQQNQELIEKPDPNKISAVIDNSNLGDNSKTNEFV